ncbi:MAG TPA: ATP-binding cassette domain-containing protein [Alkalispirochaeta sp.]|nr:ATP-binding cassette domain-containing protein [Alkalispirochaeta sp.]
MDDFLTVNDLWKSFGEDHILRGVNISFDEGAVTSIIGQSGTGKSVLIKNIIGVLEPDRGDILFRGESMVNAEPAKRDEMRRHFGYLFQDSALFDSMTVAENIAFPLVEGRGEKDRDRIAKMVQEKLEWIGLPHEADSYPAELSGGMRKRVGLARTLAVEPDVLLFDEPTTGLDPVLAATINDLITRVNEEFGITCILITHDIQATFRISDYIGFLYDGQIQAQGRPDELSKTDHPILRKFISNSFSELEV